MTYHRQDLSTAAIANGLTVRRCYNELLFFNERGQPLFMVHADAIFDPAGMLFDLSTVRDATEAEKDLFPTDGQEVTIPASSPGAQLRSEDCSVSFEQEG